LGFKQNPPVLILNPPRGPVNAWMPLSDSLCVMRIDPHRINLLREPVACILYFSQREVGLQRLNG
jgi:hypothetical protein